MNKRVRETNTNTPDCEHIKSMPLIINGIRLKCCAGHAGSCKLKVLKEIVPEYERNKKLVKSQRVHINNLERQLAEANAEIKTLKENPVTTTINNTTNNTINNVVIVADGRVFNQNAFAILDRYAKGENVFEVAYQSLFYVAETANTKKLIELHDSNDPIDRLAFNREVVENLDNGVAQIQNPLQRKSVNSRLESLNDEIDNAYQKIVEAETVD
jgi:hypothetical protein